MPQPLFTGAIIVEQAHAEHVSSGLLHFSIPTASLRRPLTAYLSSLRRALKPRRGFRSPTSVIARGLVVMRSAEPPGFVIGRQERQAFGCAVGGPVRAGDPFPSYPALLRIRHHGWLAAYRFLRRPSIIGCSLCIHSLEARVALRRVSIEPWGHTEPLVSWVLQ